MLTVTRQALKPEFWKKSYASFADLKVNPGVLRTVKIEPRVKPTFEQQLILVPLLAGQDMLVRFIPEDLETIIAITTLHRLQTKLLQV